ncbi:MAG TPA: FAD-binding oxidoreductase [Pyrinomonadaceae bacterium]|nr:FAD-binding oxidoreductase [Pyrinomonadaceae bacterium]
MQTKTALEEIQNYLTDASNMAGGHAEKLFLPETTEEIAQILRDANEQKIPVTISGARTGTVGGAVPFGGYVISMERMNTIKSIDRETMTAVVEPGVVLGDFQKAVDREGLFYPPDPTEWSCQIGGTVATNASGARSFKYGATRGFVQGLKVVLADGNTIHVSRGEAVSGDGQPIMVPTESGRKIRVSPPTYQRPDVRKNVSGFYNKLPLDAVDLFIGSEGTLGVITEIELSLLRKPEGLFSGIVFFERENDLLAFVDAVKDASFAATRGSDLPVTPSRAGAAKVDATLLEYFDDQALKFISQRFPETPAEMAGAIFFEQETTAKDEDERFENWNALLEKHNADVDRSWFTTNDQDREKMREFRHALPVAVNEFIAKHKQRKVGTDMAVPDDKFPGFLKFYKDILGASGIDYVIFGHIGDCHLHANLLPKNADEAERARHIYGRCVAQAVMLGGTVSAEHGIGKLKAKYLNVMMGERYLNEMAELKRAFDPNGILGRGNMFGL